MKFTPQDRDVNVQDGEGLTPLHHAVEGIKVNCRCKPKSALESLDTIGIA